MLYWQVSSQRLGDCRSEVKGSHDFYIYTLLVRIGNGKLQLLWKTTFNYLGKLNKIFDQNLHSYVYVPDRNTYWYAIGYMQKSVYSSSVRLVEKLETAHMSTRKNG